MKSFTITLGLLALLGLIIYGFFFRTTVPLRAYESDSMRVLAPLMNGVVTSPLAVQGEAKGAWFFEAVFPIEVHDADGTVLGRGQAHATGDWMTADFVPFTASLSFSASHSSTGTLLLKKDNPSGLPQNDLEVSIPIRFSK